MSTAAHAAGAVQQYRVYIKATPEAIWEAITRPEWTKRYGYAPLVEYELRAGGRFRAHANEGMKASGTPEVVIDGEVIEARPPYRLVQTWRMLMSRDLAAEGFSRLTYDIQPVRRGVTRLTVTHDLTRTPRIAAVLAGEEEAHNAGGGWSEVLSGLKTLLETGSQLPFQSGPDKSAQVEKDESQGKEHLFIKGLHGIRYQVRDVARSVGFYTTHLGFKLGHQQLPAFAAISLGDARILLSGPQASGSRPMPNGQKQEPGGWNRVVLRVTDLPACITELKKANVRFRNNMETGPGGRQIQIEDPDGNPIELFEPAR